MAPIHITTISSCSKASNGVHQTAAMDASHPLWVQEWTEGKGEATIRKRSSTNTNTTSSNNNAVTLYCSWFCPFAQRAWIALEELGVPYQYVEVNPYRVDPKEPGGYTKQSLSMEEKRAVMPDFMDTSPRGLVPAIRDTQGQRIWESSVVVEYLDQAYGNNRLLYSTKSAEGAALIRIYVEHCSSRIQKSYYQFLMESTKEGRDKAKQDFFRECRALACAMAPNTEEPTPQQILLDTQKKAVEEEGSKDKATTTAATGMQRVDMGSLSKVSQDALMHRLQLKPGPFFLGDQFSAVDIALAPFWQRILWVGKHYRDLTLPTSSSSSSLEDGDDTDSAFVRLEQWWQAVSQRPSVANTLVGKERLISSYKQYASNVATSDWANTMQSSVTTKKNKNKSDPCDDDDDDDDGVDNGNSNKRQKTV